MHSGFGVSERTVRNDIKDINRELKNSGLVEINQGKCSLRVFDTRDFQNAYARIIETDDLMNSSQKRQEYVFAKLMRAMEPVLTDDIAYEMNIGRSTLISDLKKLRQTMEKYELEIVGKTSKGTCTWRFRAKYPKVCDGESFWLYLSEFIHKMS